MTTSVVHIAPPEELEALEDAAAALDGAEPEEILQWVRDRYGDDVALACSFGGVSGLVLLDMVQKLNPRVEVYYVDTDFLFPETYQTVEAARARWPDLTIRSYRPDLTPDQAVTAIFYGISNAQAGLRGIPFGNLLIKQVATRLKREVPNLVTFATLSPLPHFRKDFLDPAVADGSIAGFFTQEESEALCAMAGMDTVSWAVGQLLASPGWESDGEKSGAMRAGLLRAARHYLADARKNGRAICPVAHFHGSNGALLARINWLADTSQTGIAQSAGVMVNYRYDMEHFERHQSRSLQDGDLLMAKEVQAL